VELKPTLDAKAAIEVVDKKGKAVDGATVKWDTQEGGGCVPGGAPAVLTGGKGEQAIGAGKHRIFVTAKEMTNFSDAFDFTPGQTTNIRVTLDTTKIKLEEKQIVILDKVFFETNKDIIKPESFKLLDEVASVIMANPQVGRVEVAGHTDSDGDDASNLDLSQRRSDSVKRYLEGKGVDPARLIAKGYGETKPIDSNKSAKGKANNRRVEFNLVDQAAPQGPVEVKPGTEGATPAPTK
jgi:outer membrane protein OmpA-like peptidoglycan-associated protein